MADDTGRCGNIRCRTSGARAPHFRACRRGLCPTCGGTVRAVDVGSAEDA